MINLFGTAALSALVVYGAGWAAPFALTGFAQNDIFYTYVTSGDGKRIDKGREFHDFIISLPGYHLNKPGTKYFKGGERPWEVLKNDEGRPESYYDGRPKWMQDFGYFWVGLPGQRSIHSELFAWNEYTGDVDANENKIIRSRKEDTKIFKVNTFPYVMIDTEIMTKDRFTVKVTYVLSLRITNPHIALLDTEDWFVQVAAVVSQQVRNFIGGFAFRAIVSLADEEEGSKEAKAENFSEIMEALSQKLSDEEPGTPNLKKGTTGRYGVTIVSADMQSVVPFGAQAEAAYKALVAQFLAETEKKVTEINSDAAAYATTTTGTAEAAMTKLKLQAQAEGESDRFKAAQANSEGAKIVLGTEALKEANTTYVLGNIGEAIDNLIQKVTPKT